MQKIISLLINNKYFLLFILMEIIAISLTIQSHSYHKSKFINSSNFITGGIYNNFKSFNDYLNLKDYNSQLANENTKLKNLLSNNNNETKSDVLTHIDSLIYNYKYQYINAKIINNSYIKNNNFLTLNKGKKDGIYKNMGVINSQGIVGFTTNTSAKYATVMSILNENSKINAKLLQDDHFGTLIWNGKDYKVMQFDDLPRQTTIKIGDTIITGGKSTFFPEGILIGTIKNFKIENNAYKIINIDLFNDMSAIKHINVITNLDKLEILELESQHE